MATSMLVFIWIFKKLLTLWIMHIVTHNALFEITGKAHDWFRSYLRNGKQYTSLAGCMSPLSNINLGVL